MSANKVILLGRLGAMPELKFAANAQPFCNLNVATTSRRKKPDGGWEDQTTWHRVVAFGRVAECCAQYLQKGSQVFVEGRIETEKWNDQDGKARYSTSILAHQVQFLSKGSRQDDGGATVGIETAESDPEAVLGVAQSS